MRSDLIIVFLFLHTFCLPTATTFKLITVLYNEKKKERITEYITCLEKNTSHKSINTVHVIYDTSQDDASNPLLDYLLDKKIPISFVPQRPTYAYCFALANENYPNSRIILCNADIFFNDTLRLLDDYDLHQKFLVLTRWDIQKNGKLSLLRKANGSEMSNSHDAWIFSTPISISDGNILLGTLGCDRTIAKQAQQSGLLVINPCLTVQVCHLHLSGIRNWDKHFSYPKEGSVLVPYCTLYEQPKETLPLDYATRNNKNWTPFEYSYTHNDSTLYFIYQFNPFKIVYLDGNKQVKEFFTASELINNKYWTFFHSSFDKDGKRFYVFGAITFQAQPPFNLTKISKYPILHEKFYTTYEFGSTPMSPPIHCVLFPCGFVHVIKTL